MIVSTVEKENEREGTQKLLIKGSCPEIATELINIIKELLKRGFPEDLILLIIDGVLEAVEDLHKSKRV